MSEPQLERSVLEAKEREELYAIADALGTKPGSRAKKADLITQILRATGVEPATVAEPVEKPRRTRARKAVSGAGRGRRPGGRRRSGAEAAPTSPLADRAVDGHAGRRDRPAGRAGPPGRGRRGRPARDAAAGPIDAAADRADGAGPAGRGADPRPSRRPRPGRARRAGRRRGAPAGRAATATRCANGADGVRAGGADPEPAAGRPARGPGRCRAATPAPSGAARGPPTVTAAVEPTADGQSPVATPRPGSPPTVSRPSRARSARTEDRARCRPPCRRQPAGSRDDQGGTGPQRPPAPLRRRAGQPPQPPAPGPGPHRARSARSVTCRARRRAASSSRASPSR